MSEPVAVRPLLRADAGRVADLHLLAFPDYESSRLGRSYCRRLVLAYDDRPDAWVLVAMRGEAIDGFLVGAPPAAQRQVNAALLVPWAALEYVMLSATRGLGTMRPYTLVGQVVRPVLQLALVLAVLATGAEVDLAWTWTAPYLLTGVLALTWWRRLVPARAGVPERAALPWREFWSFTAPRSLASMAQMTMQRLDIVLVAALSGPRSAAVYAAATRFVVLGQLARTAVSLAVQPQLAAELATTGHDRGPVASTPRQYRAKTLDRTIDFPNGELAVAAPYRRDRAALLPVPRRQIYPVRVQHEAGWRYRAAFGLS